MHPAQKLKERPAHDEREVRPLIDRCPACRALFRQTDVKGGNHGSSILSHDERNRTVTPASTRIPPTSMSAGNRHPGTPHRTAASCVAGRPETRSHQVSFVASPVWSQ